MRYYPLVAIFKVTCRYRMETFGDWLRAELEQRGWKQADLARATGKPTATISRIVTQQRLRPDDETLQAIARALGYPAEDVYRRANRLPPKRDTSKRDVVLRLMELAADATDEELVEVEYILRGKLERRRTKDNGEARSPAAAGRSAT